MAGKSAILSIRIVSDAKDAKKGFESTGDKAGQFGRTLRRAALVAGAAITGFAIKTARDFEQVRRSLTTATGASGDALEDLVGSVKTLATVVPASVTDIADALGILQTATGETGQTLERLTQQTMNAARLLGEDASAAATSYGKAINQWGIDAEQAATSMDYLYVLTQDYGISLTALTDQLNTYGSVLQNAGFDMNETADLFARLDQAGISLGRIMPGLNRAFRDWAQAQEDPQQALAATVEAVKNAETAQEALAIATDVFGAQGAQRMTTAIRQGVFTLDDLGAGLEDATGKLDEATREAMTLEESFQLLVNGAMVAIEPVASHVFGFLSEQLAGIATFVAENSQAFAILAGVLAGIAGVIVGVNAAVSIFRTIMTVATVATWLMNAALWAKAAAVIAATWPFLLLVAIIGAVIAVVVHLYRENETFRRIVQTAGRIAVEAFRRVMAPVRLVISVVRQLVDRVGGFRAAVILARAGGVAAFRALTAPIRAVINLVGNLISRIASIRFPSPPAWMSRVFGGAPAELVGIPPSASTLSFLPDPALTASLAPDLTASAASAATASRSLSGLGQAPQITNHYTHVEVTGAIDTKATADQIRDLLDGTDRDRGTARARSLGGRR